MLDFTNNFVPLMILPALLLIPYAIVKKNVFLLSAQLLVLIFIISHFGIRMFSNAFKSYQQTHNNPPFLKIVSSNIGQNLSESHKIDSFLELHSNCDVIFLQEITQIQIQENLSKLAISFPYHFLGPLLGNQKAGMALLSKYPFADTSNFKLSEDGLVYQQSAKIKKENQIIELYNIHLTYPWVRLRHINQVIKYPYWDITARGNEITALLKRINDNKNPVILAGDFNCNEFSHDYFRLSRSLNDAYQKVGTGLGFTWPARRTPAVPFVLSSVPFNRIDYFFYSKQFEALKCKRLSAYGSDHYPLYVELQQGRKP